jgi:energy-coupling factor transport system ATP-binding protein
MLIDLRNAGHTYLEGSQAAGRALIDISLRIGEGEFVGLIGPTGSGKTTLVQIMAGLIRPTAGEVVFDGGDVWKANPRKLAAYRQRIGLVFQEPEKQLFESTVEADVGFWPKNAGLGALEIERRAEKALGALGLDFSRYRHRSPFNLSGGEKRRVAIAGILAMSPGALILDEPTVGLDPRGRAALMERIKRLNSEGTAVILVTHDMDEVAEAVGRVVVIGAGRIVADDSPRRVFGDSERLLDLGLDVPAVTKLANLLARRGLPLGGAVFSQEELENAVTRALRGEKRK